ncbi:MAG: hypothetical protein O2816_15875 [Planctomycetota bacterium]|nr:hypothetical protein [Planctomycetota bacterium]
MSSRRGALAHWLLIGLVAIGLALSGPAHHAVCHGHGHGGGDAAHARDHCCDSTGESDGPVAAGQDSAHACPLCCLSADVPPTPVEAKGAVLGCAVSRAPVVTSTPRTHRRLAESERGPPVVV